MTLHPVQNCKYQALSIAPADIFSDARSSFRQTELDNPARSVSSSTQRQMNRAMDSLSTKVSGT
jgi:hypothetical protein